MAPVSRFLAVADIARSIAFYREVLGFAEQPRGPAHGPVVGADLVYGPARLRLVAGDEAPDSTGEPRPRGAAIVFLETADVAALREAVLARGGKPSELEKVNWIKQRMFQLEDPDGHILWFGQSFAEPVPEPAADRQLRAGRAGSPGPGLPDQSPVGAPGFRGV